LALAGHQTVTKQDLIHIGAIHARSGQGRADGHATKIVRSQAGEVALEGTHGGACSANDDDRIWCRHGLFSEKNQRV
jgi:hypothetical protein